jgi:L-cysteine:1D-myo-inositol 2-amino-2-deoxy-alpha-D-glucopyranoside ligase
LISRYLIAQGKSVQFVENITDIDDPLLERATRDAIAWQDLAASQVDLYRGDMTALRIIPPQDFVAVTDVMPLVEKAITRLIENGYTYKIDGDIYFEISSFLTDLPISQDEALTIFAERGGDPARTGKRNALDPILWMANKPGEPGWDSTHGFGRPGWHIECSVIALRYLVGPEIFEKDFSTQHTSLITIQGGGSDLIFPHHFMSAAQAQALTGVKFAQNFIHAGMVGLDGEKMSKSKGNLVFVSKLLAAGVDPMVIRFALMQSKYSEDRMWSEEVLTRATMRVERIRAALSRQAVEPVAPFLDLIALAISDDLDTPTALLHIDSWAEKTLQRSEGVNESGLMSRSLDSLLGLAL